MFRFVVVVMLIVVSVSAGQQAEAQLFRRGRIFSGRAANQARANQQQELLRQQQLQAEYQRQLERQQRNQRRDQERAEDARLDAEKKQQREADRDAKELARDLKKAAKNGAPPAMANVAADAQPGTIFYDPRTGRYFRAAQANPNSGKTDSAKSRESASKLAATVAAAPNSNNVRRSPQSAFPANQSTTGVFPAANQTGTRRPAVPQSPAQKVVPSLEGPLVDSPSPTPMEPSPRTFVVNPVEATAQPTRSNSKPPESDLKPSESNSKSSKLNLEPSESKAKPSESKGKSSESKDETEKSGRPHSILEIRETKSKKSDNDDGN